MEVHAEKTGEEASATADVVAASFWTDGDDEKEDGVVLLSSAPSSAFASLKAGEADSAPVASEGEAAPLTSLRKKRIDEVQNRHTNERPANRRETEGGATRIQEREETLRTPVKGDVTSAR